MNISSYRFRKYQTTIFLFHAKYFFVKAPRVNFTVDPGLITNKKYIIKTHFLKLTGPNFRWGFI